MLMFLWKRNRNERTDLADNIVLVSLVLLNAFASSVIVDRVVWNYSIFLCVFFAKYFADYPPLLKKNSWQYFVFVFLLLYESCISAVGLLEKGYYLNLF